MPHIFDTFQFTPSGYLQTEHFDHFLSLICSHCNSGRPPCNQPLDSGNEISSNLLSDQEMLLVQQHCGNCHANKPSFPGYAVAPGGMVLDSLQALDGYRPLH